MKTRRGTSPLFTLLLLVGCHAPVGAPDGSGADGALPEDGASRDADAPPGSDAAAPDADGDSGFEDAETEPDPGPSPDAEPPPPLRGTRSETPARIRHLYSQLQAWSSDAQYFLGTDLDTSETVVLEVASMRERARLGRVGPRWIPGTHSVLMFDDQPSTGAALFAYDVDSQRETEILRLGHPGLRAGRSHEELDRGGRYVAVYIDQASSGGPRIVTADVVGKRVMADVSIAELGCDFEPDWVGIDPTGRYLLVQSVRAGRGACSGLWVHDVRTGAALRQLTDHRNHGTTGVGPGGEPYFLTMEIAHPNDNGSQGLYRYWLDDARREVVGGPMPWGALQHASCLGGPGEACIISGSNEFSSPYTGNIWRLDFDGTRTVLEPHRAQGCDYWGQAHATVGPNGRYAFVTHGGDCGRIHSVLVE